jgi:hypothetical protein
VGAERPAAGPGQGPAALDCPLTQAEDPAGFLEIVTLGRQLAGQGYAPGAPAHVTPRTLALDQAAAEEAGCPECGCHDVTLAPYHKASRFRYAANCPDCRAQWEG